MVLNLLILYTMYDIEDSSLSFNKMSIENGRAHEKLPVVVPVVLAVQGNNRGRKLKWVNDTSLFSDRQRFIRL